MWKHFRENVYTVLPKKPILGLDDQGLKCIYKNNLKFSLPMYIFAPILTTVQERDKRSLSQSSVNNDTLLHA